MEEMEAIFQASGHHFGRKIPLNATYWLHANINQRTNSRVDWLDQSRWQYLRLDGKARWL